MSRAGGHFHGLTRVEEGALHVHDEQRGVTRHQADRLLEALAAIHGALTPGRERAATRARRRTRSGCGGWP